MSGPQFLLKIPSATLSTTKENDDINTSIHGHSSRRDGTRLKGSRRNSSRNNSLPSAVVHTQHFPFRAKGRSLDWELLAKIDIDALYNDDNEEEVDMLLSFVGNMISANLDKEELEQGNVHKLLQAQQLISEYLVWENKMCHSACDDTKGKMSSMQEDITRTHQSLNLMSDQNSHLKRQLRSAKRLYHNYERVLRQRGLGHHIETDVDAKMEKEVPPIDPALVNELERKLAAALERETSLKHEITAAIAEATHYKEKASEANEREDTMRRALADAQTQAASKEAALRAEHSHALQSAQLASAQQLSDLKQSLEAQHAAALREREASELERERLRLKEVEERDIERSRERAKIEETWRTDREHMRAMMAEAEREKEDMRRAKEKDAFEHERVVDRLNWELQREKDVCAREIERLKEDKEREKIWQQQAHANEKDGWTKEVAALKLALTQAEESVAQLKACLDGARTQESLMDRLSHTEAQKRQSLQEAADRERRFEEQLRRHREDTKLQLQTEALKREIMFRERDRILPSDKALNDQEDDRWGAYAFSQKWWRKVNTVVHDEL